MTVELIVDQRGLHVAVDVNADVVDSGTGGVRIGVRETSSLERERVKLDDYRINEVTDADLAAASTERGRDWGQ